MGSAAVPSGGGDPSQQQQPQMWPLQLQGQHLQQTQQAPVALLQQPESALQLQLETSTLSGAIAAVTSATEAVKAALAAGHGMPQNLTRPSAMEVPAPILSGSPGSSVSTLPSAVQSHAGGAASPFVQHPGVPLAAAPVLAHERVSAAAVAAHRLAPAVAAGEEAVTPRAHHKGDDSEDEDDPSGLGSTPTPARGASGGGKLPPKRRVTPPISGSGISAGELPVVLTTEMQSPRDEGTIMNDAEVSKALREAFDLCDVEGRGRVSKGRLAEALRSNSRLTEVLKLPKEWDFAQFEDAGTFGSDEVITWAEFSAQSTRWSRTVPSTAKGHGGAGGHRSSGGDGTSTPRGRSPSRGTTKSPVTASPVNDSSTTGRNSPDRLPSSSELRFATWNDRQTSQHRQARSWLLAQALMPGVAQGHSNMASQQVQLRVLARDIDVQILCAAATSGQGNGVPLAESRLAISKPYVDLLRADVIQDLAHHAAAIPSTTSPIDVPQAEVALRTLLVQLEKALLTRLSGLTDEARQLHVGGSSAISSRGGSASPQPPVLSMGMSTAAKARLAWHG